MLAQRREIDRRGTQTTAEERGTNPTAFTPLCAGIAGRVTSNAGPGDVWEPTGLRGVQLKSGGTGGGNAPPVIAPPLPPVTEVGEGRFAGSPGLAVLMLLALAAGLRAAQRRSAQA